MKKVTLKVEKRIVTGKKVKQLRKQGTVPGNLFGKNISSQAISFLAIDFKKTLSEAGGTTVVSLDLDGKSIPVLIKKTQIHPLTDAFIHVDFLVVDLTKKVKAMVPVEITGVSPAVSNMLGVLLELTDEVEVEALPTDLPEQILVDVSKLDKVGAIITVGDVVAMEGVTVLTAKETELVKIGELISKEAEAQAKAEAEAAATQQAVVASQSAEKTPAEASVTPPVEAKKEEKKAPPAH